MSAQDFLFGGDDVLRRFAFRMEQEIDKGRAAKFNGRKTLVEIARGDDPVDHLLRNGRAGLVMDGKFFQDFRPQGPMFIELRRQFDEIGRRRRTAHRRIDDIGQHAVQGVAEFVEQGEHFGQGQQGRAAGEPA